MALDGLPNIYLRALLPIKNSIKLVLHLNWTLVKNPWYFSGTDPSHIEIRGLVELATIFLCGIIVPLGSLLVIKYKL